MSRPASPGLAVKSWGLVGLALLLVVVWWWGAQGVTDNAQALANSPPLSHVAPPSLPAVPDHTAIAHSTAPAPNAHIAAAPAAPSEAEKAVREKALAQREAAAQARREQTGQEHAATEEKARTALVLEQQQVDRAARLRAAAETAQQAVVAKTVRPPPAPALKTVAQTCADSGNFFSREACRLRSCGAATFASDPVCVRFRDMEMANRRALAN